MNRDVVGMLLATATIVLACVVLAGLGQAWMGGVTR